MREKIERFYRDWDPSELLKVVGEENFGRREFAVARYPDGKMIRHLYFPSVDELKRYLIEATPLKAYVGSVYMYPRPIIPKGTSVSTLQVLYRELTFDIDLTDYNDVRREINPGCKCLSGAKIICNKCWPLANRALVILKRFAEEILGTDKYEAYFSGRRGVHFRIYDEDARRLTEDERIKLAGFIQLISSTGDKVSVKPPTKSTSLRLITFEETVIFRIKSGEGKLKDLLDRIRPYKPPVKSYRKIIKDFIDKGIRSFDYLRLVDRLFDSAFDSIKDIVRRYYVRVDAKALTDSKRLMKIPGSLDASTMAVVERIPKEEYDSWVPPILRK